jgi:thioredoxin-like negative regulator of GroEL
MTVDYDGTQDLHASTVRFTASWCNPCKLFAPMFDKVAERSAGSYVVVDVDKHPITAGEFKVMSIPTVFVHGVRIEDPITWAKNLI